MEQKKYEVQRKLGKIEFPSPSPSTPHKSGGGCETQHFAHFLWGGGRGEALKKKKSKKLKT